MHLAAADSVQFPIESDKANTCRDGENFGLPSGRFRSKTYAFLYFAELNRK